jgi:CRISPR-associated endoribonuclease Cas6
MRLLLKLKLLQTREFTYNYHYPLSSAIYNILHFGSPEFAEFLHDKGFKLEGKTYKLFSFALKCCNARPEKDHLKLLVPDIELYISSPLVDQFIQTFAIGTFQSHLIELYADFRKYQLSVQSVEVLQEPIFTSEMKFIPLSPIVISTKKEFNNKLKPYYFRYNDDINEINRILNKNLLNKCLLLNENTDNLMEGVTLSWDRQYIEDATSSKRRLTSKITIDASDRKIDIIGNRLPFTLKGDPGLIRTGYLCGFGEKNSMGFGMAELCR